MQLFLDFPNEIQTNGVQVRKIQYNVRVGPIANHQCFFVTTKGSKHYRDIRKCN